MRGSQGATIVHGQPVTTASGFIGETSAASHSMNVHNRRTLTRGALHILAIRVALALFAGACLPHWCGAARAQQTFYVQGLANKCLTYAVPPAANGAVFLSACDHGIHQQVGVQEVLDVWGQQLHEVELKAGALCIGAELNVLGNNVPLVLQPCANSPAQVFALDGDSIILAADRDLVAQVFNAIPADGTTVVLGRRNLAPPEFWTFTATDNSGRPPTTGFVTVADAKDFCNAMQNARYGAVIQLVGDINAADVTNPSVCPTPLTLPVQVLGGVTIRGDRNGVLEGPQISLPAALAPGTLFQATGPDVRLTGLRILGPSRSTDSGQPESYGITSSNQLRTIVDHNDISDWTAAGVNILGPPDGDDDDAACNKGISPPSRLLNARVVRNFIHHNEMDSLGYGAVTGWDGYSSIEGNTFVENRHAIAADSSQFNSYNAVYNLVLSTVPTYGFLGHDVEHDFDMHGSADGSHHQGGVAGNSVLISGNTFLGTNRSNFILRGNSCGFDEFVNNISMHGQDGAVEWFCGGGLCGSGSPPSNLTINSTFGAGDPTQRLAVGDFDGDGVDDLFLATGSAWYYAPAGNAEWRFLNAQPQTIDNLLFGDIDGDGRTDVLMKNGQDWFVSWGGISPWQKINESDGPISDYAIGDFVGDARADIFHADGHEWHVSDAGTGPFNFYATSSYRVSDLRFGDFDGDGKTDVMGIVDNQWMAVFANQAHQWQRLNAKLSDSVNNLYVADFDGNNKADIATVNPIVGPNHTALYVWAVSRDGVGPWTGLAITSLPFVATGRFDNVTGADILVWNGNTLDILSSGQAPPVRQSRQDMR